MYVQSSKKSLRRLKALLGVAAAARGGKCKGGWDLRGLPSPLLTLGQSLPVLHRWNWSQQWPRQKRVFPVWGHRVTRVKSAQHKGSARNKHGIFTRLPRWHHGKERACQWRRCQSLCPEDPLEEEMTTHSSILAWKIPMDRGGWRATVRVQSQIWLSTHTHSNILKHQTADTAQVLPTYRWLPQT